MKILTVLGARPQFVKAGIVSRQIAKTEGISEVLVHLGQHYDPNMSDVFFSELELPKPDYHFKQEPGTHANMTANMLRNSEEVMMKERPDYVLVYGDTNSTLAGALAAAKLRIPIAHVEAGLRSFDMHMPEEINRVLTDRLSQKLFCPTAVAISNLRKEGYEHNNCEIVNTGDVMYDAMLYYREKALKKTGESRLKAPNGSFALATIHRQSNTDNPEILTNLIAALNQLAEQHPVLMPVHPRTRKMMSSYGIKAHFDIIDPVGYLDMIRLLDQCALVVTDSGGLQKEAYFHNKYCLTLREETEWTELVHAGQNYLVGSQVDEIVSRAVQLWDKTYASADPLYGNGDATLRIVENLIH